MNISVIGLGYVGLVTSACLANMGNRVIAIDKDKRKLEELKKGNIYIYEENLNDLCNENFKNGNLIYSNDLEYAVTKSDIIFICVGTPPCKDGSVDTSQVESAILQISKFINNYKIIVIKSTVPIGTNNKLSNLLKKHIKNNIEFDIACNPEFLKEGSAINDFYNGDRIILGSNNDKVLDILSSLYKPLNQYIFKTSPESAEAIKYASNAFLSMKISFINEVAKLCIKTKVNIDDVSYGLTLDKRIGNGYLNTGTGFGGYCLPKDTRAFENCFKENDINPLLISSIIKRNNTHIQDLTHDIEKIMKKSKGKSITILGLSFKGSTNDIRESCSIYIARNLIERGFYIKAYDPAVDIESISDIPLEYFDNPYDASYNTNAILILSDWPEFVNIDLDLIKEKSSNCIFIDCKNLFNGNDLINKGFEYYSIGRSYNQFDTLEGTELLSM